MGGSGTTSARYSLLTKQSWKFEHFHILLTSRHCRSVEPELEMPYKISLPLAELVFLFLVKSANKRVQLGQKNVQK